MCMTRFYIFQAKTPTDFTHNIKHSCDTRNIFGKLSGRTNEVKLVVVVCNTEEGLAIHSTRVGVGIALIRPRG